MAVKSSQVWLCSLPHRNWVDQCTQQLSSPHIRNFPLCFDFLLNSHSPILNRTSLLHFKRCVFRVSPPKYTDPSGRSTYTVCQSKCWASQRQSLGFILDCRTTMAWLPHSVPAWALGRHGKAWEVKSSTEASEYLSQHRGDGGQILRGTGLLPDWGLAWLIWRLIRLLWRRRRGMKEWHTCFYLTPILK